MKHAFKRIMATVLVLIMVFAPTTVGMMYVHGADEGDASTGSGNKPIAAYDSTGGDLSDHSERKLADIAPFYGSAWWEERAAVDAEKGVIKLGETTMNEDGGYNGGFFSLPNDLFTGLKDEGIALDGFTISITMTKTETDTWNDAIFSFSTEDKDRWTLWEWNQDPNPRVSSSIYMCYNGCVGSGTHPYAYDEGGGSWLDGGVGTALLPLNEEHSVTLTYDPEYGTNGLVLLYIDGKLEKSSADVSWEVQAKLTKEDILNFSSCVIGRQNAGNHLDWLNAEIKDITVYATALTEGEVDALVNASTIKDGWAAVEHYGEGMHTVTYIYDDGVTPASTQKVADGAEIELPALYDRETDDGFFSIWDGWLCDADGEIYGGYDWYTVTEDVTFTAQWIDEICYATFDANGGVCANGFELYRNELEGGTEITLPGAAKLNGYAFTGWLCSRDQKVYQPGDAYVVMRNVTFTAQWGKLYKVTFVDEDGETVGTVLKQYGETLTESDYPKVPVKEGYRVEWPLITDPITSDMTIKAIYTRIPPVDIDGDGDLTNADALAIFLHIFSPDEYPLDIAAADIDHDGAITNGDALMIFLYLFDPVANPIV